MKLLFIFFIVVSFVTCNSSNDKKAEQAAIAKLLDDESHFAPKAIPYNGRHAG